MTEPWVSVEDVAKHLGVVKDSIYRWIERRGLPAKRVGRLWKFKLSEVDEWVRRWMAATAWCLAKSSRAARRSLARIVPAEDLPPPFD
jgi:excisionase family DNA binding protein